MIRYFTFTQRGGYNNHFLLMDGKPSTDSYPITETSNQNRMRFILSVLLNHMDPNISNLRVCQKSDLCIYSTPEGAYRLYAKGINAQFFAYFYGGILSANERRWKKIQSKREKRNRPKQAV